MNRLLPWIVLSAVATILPTAHPAVAFERPVLTLSSPSAKGPTRREIRTADPIMVAGRLVSLFRSDVKVEFYHLLPTGRAVFEHGATVPVSQEGTFEFELAAPRGGWLAGTLRVIASVRQAPQVRQEFELNVTGDPVPEQVTEALKASPPESGATLTMTLPQAFPDPRGRVSFGSSLSAVGHVLPQPPAGTRIELLVHHLLADGRFVRDAAITIPLQADGQFVINLSPPRRGWKNGRRVGVIRRQDRPDDRQTFEASIVGAPENEAESLAGVLLPVRSKVPLDVREAVLPDIQAGMSYVITGESAGTPPAAQKEGLPVMLELAEGRGNQAKGLIHQSGIAPTLVNEAGVLEFETEMEIPRSTPPGTYQLYVTPLSPRRFVSKVHNILVLPADPAGDEGSPASSAGRTE